MTWLKGRIDDLLTYVVNVRTSIFRGKDNELFWINQTISIINCQFIDFSVLLAIVASDFGFFGLVANDLSVIKIPPLRQ